MKFKEIINYLEHWAPKAIAWEKDNIGLQIGNPGSNIENVMISLDLTEDVIKQAISKRCNLIITHHPTFFQPLRNLNFASGDIPKQVETLIKNNINLYAAHTNLDFTKDGVSYQLAKRLDLKNLGFFKHLTNNQVKLVVFVPASRLNVVADAIHSAGGGVIGEYFNCSFRTEGIGSFKGSEISKPSIGSKGKTELVEEVKFEVLVDEWNLSNVIHAMKKAHPYEEVAYDVITLKNENVNYGIGATGELQRAMNVKDFLKYTASSLNINNLRYTPGKNRKVKTVAVCGGSCVEILKEAINKNIDVFITADLKFHSFLDAKGKILLIDAGHYETELPVLDEVQRRIKKFIGSKRKNKVFKFKGSTNPVVFYNK